MSDLPFNLPWAAALFAALAWTTAFSLLNRPLRGLRNLGILASYCLGIAMMVTVPWRAAIAVWVAFALAGGITYAAYEAWSRRRYSGEGEGRSLALLRHALLMWPIMLPEAVEYLLAEFGVLKPPPAAGRAPGA